MIAKKPQIKPVTIMKHLFKTFLRFPVSLVSATVLLVIFLLAHIFPHLSEETLIFFPFINLLLHLGIYISAAITIFCERQKIDRVWSILLSLFGVGATFLLMPLSSYWGIQYMFYVYILLWIISLVSIFIAPYITSGSSMMVWKYAFQLLTRLLITVVLTAVLFLSLVAINLLPGIDLSSELMTLLSVSVICLIVPWYFLAGVPKDYTQEMTEDTYPYFLRLFTQYLVVPFVSIYFLILAMYSVWIVAIGQWPEGVIATHLIVFFCSGLFGVLLLYPFRTNRWFHNFRKAYFVAVLLLVPVYLYAVYLRVDAYGLTVDRILMLLFGLWIVIVALYELLIPDRLKNLRILALIGFVILVLAVVTPGLNMIDLSTQSQLHRFESMLEESHSLSDGVVDPERVSNLNLDTRQELLSIVEYLVNYGDPSELRHLIPAERYDTFDDLLEESTYPYSRAKGLMQLFGIAEEKHDLYTEGSVYYKSLPSHGCCLPHAGYLVGKSEYVLRLTLEYDSSNEVQQIYQDETVTYTLEGTEDLASLVLVVDRTGEDLERIALGEYLDTHFQENILPVQIESNWDDPMISEDNSALIFEEDGVRYRVYIEKIGFYLKEEALLRYYDAQIMVFIDLPDEN